MNYWDKRDGESEPAYDAFRCYRDQPRGERSLRKTAAELAKSMSLVTKWSRKQDWVDRVAAWDEHLDAITDKKLEESLLATRKRHRRVAERMIEKALERLEQMHLTEMSAGDVIRMISEGVKIEALALGEATSRIDHTGFAAPAAGEREALAQWEEVLTNADSDGRQAPDA
jgi:hypothetical protein